MASDLPLAYEMRCTVQGKADVSFAKETLLNTQRAYQGLVEEGEALHGRHSPGSRSDLRKYNPGLASQPDCLHHHDVQDRAELGENGVEALLELYVGSG